MKTRHDILLDVAKIAGTRYFNRALLLGKTLLVARWLGPASYGLVGVVALVPLYGQWTDLGLFGALTRQLPLLDETPEDREKRRAMIDTAFTSSALTATLAMASIIGVALLTTSGETLACTLAAALVIGAQLACRFFENLLRVRQEFGPVARANALLELSGLVYTLTLVYLFGAPGFFLSLVLANLTGALFLMRRLRGSGWMPGWRLDLRLTGRMLIGGLPLVTTSILHNLLLSMDRAVMSRAVDTTLVGHYMLALLIANILQYLPDSASYILFPALRQRLGKGVTDMATLQRYLREPTEAIAWVMPFFIAGATLCLPLVPLVLPAYRPGLEPARVLIVFTFFTAINSVALSHLTAYKEYWKHLLAAQAVVTAISPVLVLAALRLGYGVTGVAGAMGLAYLLYGLSSQGLALQTCGLGPRAIAADLLRLCVPFFYLAPMLIAIRKLIDGLELTSIGATAAGLALFVPLSIPLFWGLSQRTPLLQLARRAMKLG